MKRIVLTLSVLLSTNLSALAAVEVHDAWCPARPPGSSTAVVYFRLQNGHAGAVQLLGAQTSIAEKAEVHQHRNENGMLTMRPVPVLTIPEGEQVDFMPGSYHLMLFGLKEPPMAGEHFPLRLDFSDGSNIELTVEVRGLEAPK